MKIFVAGATGAIGKPLVRMLVAAEHEVTGTTRTPEKTEEIRAMGATPAILDALDADAVGAAVAEASPDVIVHQLTALADLSFSRNFDRAFAQTNRLRTEGTDHLLAAARAAGTRRFIAQSFAGWFYAPSGNGVVSEDDPRESEAPEGFRSGLEAIAHVERSVAGADWIEGLVLRYGGFYGPGTSISAAPDADQVAAIRKRRFPLIGDGAGVWSFIHVEDAAAATAAAVEHGAPGIYNIVDDEPAPVSVWLPAAAELFGAKPPRRIPRWLARIVAGELVTIMMTEVRGASNEKAKRELGWRPRYGSWREGFATGLG
jgi:nucleoside-diphosphate-sugar epimerase